MHTGPAALRGQGPRAGFSLVELLVVIGIITLLVTLLTVAVVAVKRYWERTEARLAMQQMAAGFTSLKREYDLDPGAPLAVWGGGRVAAGTAEFTDPGRDFAAAGIGPGDEVLVLTPEIQFRRAVTARTGNVLTLAGAPFPATRNDLVYFVIRSGDGQWPEIQPDRELDPRNPAWAAGFTPHVNTRGIRQFDPTARRIRDGRFRDPWGTPYGYRLAPGPEAVAEQLFSAGPDAKPGTADDLVQPVTEVPFKP